MRTAVDVHKDGLLCWVEADLLHFLQGIFEVPPVSLGVARLRVYLQAFDTLVCHNVQPVPILSDPVGPCIEHLCAHRVPTSPQSAPKLPVYPAVTAKKGLRAFENKPFGEALLGGSPLLHIDDHGEHEAAALASKAEGLAWRSADHKARMWQLGEVHLAHIGVAHS